MLAKKLDVIAIVYLDDILVFSLTEQDHAEHLRWVLEKLRKRHLKAKRKKSALRLNKLKYLGHVIKQNPISMDP